MSERKQEQEGRVDDLEVLANDALTNMYGHYDSRTIVALRLAIVNTFTPLLAEIRALREWKTKNEVASKEVADIYAEVVQERDRAEAELAADGSSTTTNAACLSTSSATS